MRATAKALEQDAQNRLTEWPELSVRQVWQPRTDTQSLIRTIQAEGCQLLALPGESTYLANEMILALLVQVDCPVLLAS